MQGTTKKRKSNNVETAEELEQKAKRRAQIAKAAKKHRERQKKELIMLRSNIATLERELDDMQAGLPDESALEVSWQMEAKQQAEIRVRVDRENEFLRSTLFQQIKFTERLQEGLARQPALLNLSSNCTETSVPSKEMTVMSNGPTITDLEVKKQSLIKYGKEGIIGAKRSTHNTEQMLNQLQVPLIRDVEQKVYYRNHQFDLNLRTTFKDMDASDFIHTAFVAAQDEEFNNQITFLSASFTVQTIDSDTALVKQVYRLDTGLSCSNLVVLRKQTVGNTSWMVFRSIKAASDSPTKDDPSHCDEFTCLRITQLSPLDDGTKMVELVFRSQGALPKGMDSEEHTKVITENGGINWVKALEEQTRKIHNTK